MKCSACSKTYDGRTVLKLPELELRPGKICAVIGANGSGKSTFAKLLAGVELPDEKHCPLDSTVSVGYLPQRSYAYRMNVRNNVLLGGKESERADRLLEAVQLSHLAKKRADRLSGGETARMALARLMMKAFDVVILDEPTAAMDMETTALTEALMMEYCQETGCAMLLVTHSLQQARRLADEAMFLKKGRLVEFGAKDTVLYTPEKQETKAFLQFYGI